MKRYTKVLLAILFLANFLFLLIRVTPLFTLITNALNYKYAKASYTSITYFNLAVIVIYVGTNLLVYLKRDQIYKKLKNILELKYIILILVILGAILFHFMKEDYLQIPDINSSGYSQVYNTNSKNWENVNKLYPIEDEVCYMMLADVIKQEGVANYFKYLEDEKFDSYIKGQIWRAQKTHPPLYYFWLSVFPGSFSMRFGNFILFVLTAIALYFLILKIDSKNVALATMTIVFFAPHLFTFEAMMSHNDLFVTLLITISVLFILKYKFDYQVLLSGAFLGIALVAKYTAFIVLPLILIYIVFYSREEKRNVVIDISRFVVPAIAIFMIWVFSAWGTNIGEYHWYKYVTVHFLGNFGGDIPQFERNEIRISAWKSPLTMFAESINFFTPAVIFLYASSFRYYKKYLNKYKLEYAWLVMILPVMLLGVYMVNPLLRYAMPVLFVIPFFAVIGIKEIFKNDNASRFYVVFLICSTGMAKILIKLGEHL